MSPLVTLALSIARAEVGVREHGGNNRGPRVEEYLHSVGAQPGDSWCAAFIFFCFDKAAKELGLPNPCPRTAGALKMLRQSQIGYHTDEPTEGSIVAWNHGDGLGHVGFVDEPGDPEFLVLSGNSNTSGSRNGVEVCIHPTDRHASNIAGFVDFSRILLPQAESLLVT